MKRAYRAKAGRRPDEQAAIRIGDKLGHWTVKRDASYETTNGTSYHFVVESECGARRKVSGWVLLTAMSENCAKCKSTMPTGGFAKLSADRRAAIGLANARKHFDMGETRRCQVQERGIACGAVVQVAKLAEHLWSVHEMVAIPEPLEHFSGPLPSEREAKAAERDEEAA